jgi:serine/threonine protein kinase
MMQQLLAPDPEKRLSAAEALMHPWLTGAMPSQVPALDDDEECMEEASTEYTYDIEGTDSDSYVWGDSADCDAGPSRTASPV